MHRISKKQQENRQRLVAALRAPLPEGFKWNFSILYESSPNGCSTGCAIGLAYKLEIITEPSYKDLTKALGLSKSRAQVIFVPAYFDNACAVGYDLPPYRITPKIVASVLEREP